MMKISITEDMIRRAEARAGEMGELKNSFTHGEGNVVGFVGEEISLTALEGARMVESYDFDIEFCGKRFEVKTKRTSVDPLPEYMCSVSTFNNRQKADYYLFCRVLYSGGSFGKHGWVLGYIPVEEFKKKSVFMMKGTREGNNGYIVKSNCFSLPISELYNVEGLLQ